MGIGPSRQSPRPSELGFGSLLAGINRREWIAMAEPMTMDEKIKRINELYHKSQAEGLSAEEKDEQARLRKEYINSVKVNLRSQLNNINIQNEDGSVTNLGKKNAE